PTPLVHTSLDHVLLYDPPTPVICTLSLHDALPICSTEHELCLLCRPGRAGAQGGARGDRGGGESGHRAGQRSGRGQRTGAAGCRSEEHTSELQSRENLVCRLLLEKKKKMKTLDIKK